jgi:hypothetical protein
MGKALREMQGKHIGNRPVTHPAGSDAFFTIPSIC